MNVGDVVFGTVLGPGTSNEVAVIVCSAPSLIDVTLDARFHPSFYEALCEKGKTATVSKIQLLVKMVKLIDVRMKNSNNENDDGDDTINRTYNLIKSRNANNFYLHKYS